MHLFDKKGKIISITILPDLIWMRQLALKGLPHN